MDGASHVHSHDHSHDHSHEHDNGHAHAAPARARPARPTTSLLRMSAAERLTVAGGAVAVIWMGVVWAMS